MLRDCDFFPESSYRKKLFGLLVFISIQSTLKLAKADIFALVYNHQYKYIHDIEIQIDPYNNLHHVFLTCLKSYRNLHNFWVKLKVKVIGIL